MNDDPDALTSLAHFTQLPLGQGRQGLPSLWNHAEPPLVRLLACSVSSYFVSLVCFCF